MKKKLLLFTATLMMTVFVSFGQIVNGPGYFNTYLENFEDSSYVQSAWTFAHPTGYIFKDMTNKLVPEGGYWLLSKVQAGNYLIYDGGTFENYTVSCNICPRYGNMMGILFNYQDDANFYYIHLVAADLGDKLIYVGQKVKGLWNLKGTFTNLLRTSNASEGGLDMFADPVFGPRSNSTADWGGFTKWGSSTVTLTVKNNAGKTSVWIAGNLVFNEVSTPLFTKGKIGLIAESNPGFFDNLVIEANAAPGTGIINTEAASAINIYPNPVANGIFTIKTPNLDSSSKVEIFDITGKMVYSQLDLNSNELRINSNKLTGKGIYNVKVTSDKKVSNGKLIVR